MRCQGILDDFCINKSPVATSSSTCSQVALLESFQFRNELVFQTLLHIDIGSLVCVGVHVYLNISHGYKKFGDLFSKKVLLFEISTVFWGGYLSRSPLTFQGGILHQALEVSWLRTLAAQTPPADKMPRRLVDKNEGLVQMIFLCKIYVIFQVPCSVKCSFSGVYI